MSTLRLSVLALVLIAACSGPAPAGTCSSSTECPTGRACIDGRCAAIPDAASGTDAFTPADAACVCAAGESCASGHCVADCGDPTAVPCEGTDTCDYATAHCVPAGTAALSGAGVQCGGAGGPTCLPGTECAPNGQCEPAPPCAAMHCTSGNGTCWGAACLTTRPVAACTPAPLSRLQMADFLLGGDNGITDFELDDACNAYGVTVISGPDYLRQVAPDGTLTVTTGVTNLNMGEVAVLRPYSSEFGTSPGEVALTYTCCVACGCVGTDPQGVAHLDRTSSSLPMVVTATPSTGTGPFGVSVLDSGPYGLTWGRDRTLYVGNVMGEGDFVRADLVMGTSAMIADLGQRVYASATFDTTSLLVALADGSIQRVSTDGLHVTPWATVTPVATSLVRDPFLGRVYVSLADGTVASYAADGTSPTPIADAGAAGRIAYSPDGALYYLRTGFGHGVTLERIELPSTLP